MRDLGHVTAEVQDELVGADSVKKYNGGLSSSRVGARRSSGRSPASSGVGRPAGGARTLAPLYSEPALLTENAHRVSLLCLSASSAGFLTCRTYLVGRGSRRLTPLCSSIASDALLWRRRRARVAWIKGSNAVRTPVGDPLEHACVHAYAAGTGATVGPARGGPSAPSNHWIPPVFGKVWGDLKSDS